MRIEIRSSVALLVSAAWLGALATGCVVHDDVGRDPHYVDPHAGEHHEDHPQEQRQSGPRPEEHQEEHHP